MRFKRVKHNTTKIKSSRVKSNMSKSINSNKSQNTQQHNLIDLISMITQERKNKTKSQSNLPARLMGINKINKTSKPQSYSKSVSSSYSSIMHNGQKHIKGKEVINDSTKPFIKINEMEDGSVNHYMVPKNTIPYNQSLQLPLSITSNKLSIPMSMNNSMNKIMSNIPIESQETQFNNSLILPKTTTKIKKNIKKKKTSKKNKSNKKKKTSKNKKTSKKKNTSKKRK